jgi:hypothetical protein
MRAGAARAGLAAESLRDVEPTAIGRIDRVFRLPEAR